MNKTYNDFKNIVLNKTPLIDVRAPIEFVKGAFINAVNIPVMDDKQRKQVGICYKEQGNEAATKLGYELVSGQVKQKCLDGWKKQIEENPDTLIYCFRGGARSQISQQWIYEATGKTVLRLEGGYKAFRNYLIDELDPKVQTSKPILLGGCTGCGKTILLNQIENAVDLEGIANHRGSSFGIKVTGQPTQIGFENNLAYAIINHRQKGFKHMILEDEGKNVGANFIPKPLAEYFNNGDLVILDAPIETRIDITRQEYVSQSQIEYQEFYGQAEGKDRWAEYISGSLNRIKKRLGAENHINLINMFNNAYQHQLKTGDVQVHNDWIRVLLEDYYDPMYLHQIKKTTKKIIYKGEAQDVLEFLKTFN